MKTRLHFAFSLILVISLSPRFVIAAAGLEVDYDHGTKKGGRQFVSASPCADQPCTITQSGAIRLPIGIEKNHRVQLVALHRGTISSIALFQESTTFEQKVSERIFNRIPNRKVVDLERLLETGKTGTIYMYGVLLQHDLDEGDLIALKLTSLKNPSEVEEYFFRYHHDGLKFDVDLAFVQPISLFSPNPGGVIQSAYSTVALSFSAARAMDPDRHYRLISKVMRAVRVNLTAGLLIRKDVHPFNGDNITQEAIDGFGGLGLTFFDFLALGYGANFARSPHTTFPYVGIEVRHLFEFLRSLKSDTHTRWQKYLKEEMARPSDQSKNP